ncbi:MAG: stage II sporulation protein, partial [Actinomycetota bacterium]
MTSPRRLVGALGAWVLLLAWLWAPGGRVGAAAVGSLDLTGHGYGHGIGLSQWGAYGYAAEHGWTAAQ